MADLDEVAGRDAAAFDVVGDHLRHTIAPAVDEHDGHTRGAQAKELGGRRWHRHDEQPVGPIAPVERREMLVAVQR